MEELETVGRAYVPYPSELWSAVEKAVASWKQFCGLDELVRMQFPYDRETNMGVGYELKKELGAHRDLKEDFHITLHSKGWLLDAARKIKDPATLQFVSDAAALAEALQPIIVDLAKDIERICPSKFFGGSTRKQGSIVLRSFSALLRWERCWR